MAIGRWLLTKFPKKSLQAPPLFALKYVQMQKRQKAELISNYWAMVGEKTEQIFFKTKQEYVVVNGILLEPIVKEPRLLVLFYSQQKCVSFLPLGLWLEGIYD